MEEENEVNKQLNSLQKSHRTLSEKIAKINEKRNKQYQQGESVDFKACTARVTRQDLERKCPGTLTVSQTHLRFLPSVGQGDYNNINMPLTHVLSAQMNNLRNVPELTIILNPDVPGYASYELRFINEPYRLQMIYEFLSSRSPSKRNVENREVKQLEQLPTVPISQLPEPEIIGESSILKVVTFKKLIQRCPKQVMFFPWKLQYSLGKHGSSMYAFYERLKGCQFTMLLIKDTTHAVFGAYLCEEWHSSDKHYGKFETFVFRENEGDVEVWNSTDDDSFYQFSDENIFVGVKDRSAIWLSNNFVLGNTSPCPTFASPPLIKNNESTVDFQVLFLEVWAPSYDF